MIVPYVGPIEGGTLTTGSSIRVFGNILPQASRFAINLQCGPSVYPRDDVAFHFSPDFGRGCVIRNTIIHNSWSPEEFAGTFPFTKGKSFDVVFTCDEQEFKVAVEGQHFTSFSHRISYKRVTHVAIDGDISLGGIQQQRKPKSSYGFMVGGNSAPLPTYPSPPYAQQPPPYQYPNMTPSSQPPYNPPNVPYAPHIPHVPYPYYPTIQHQPYPSQLGQYPNQHPANLYPTQPGQPTVVTQSPKHQKVGLLDKAGMALAGTLAGGGIVGSVLHGKKGIKSSKKAQKKALKYGLPIAGVGLGAYALKKGFHRSSSSSSSSSD